MTFALQYAETLRFGLFNMGWVFVLLWGFEQLWPRGEQARLSDMLRALKFWMIYAVASALFIVTVGRVVGGLTPPVRFHLQDWVTGWPIYILGPLFSLLVYDFFNYWMHRAQHKWFWRQHAIHHSIERLSGLNSYFHWTEDLFRIAFITVPMTAILGIQAGGASLVSVMILKAYGNMLHSPTRLHLGPLGRVLADNRWHRIHHSIEPAHFDKNFGTGVTLWDHIFRTAYVPAKDEWPATGVPDFPELDSAFDYIRMGRSGLVIPVEGGAAQKAVSVGSSVNSNLV